MRYQLSFQHGIDHMAQNSLDIMMPDIMPKAGSGISRDNAAEPSCRCRTTFFEEVLQAASLKCPLILIMPKVSFTLLSWHI